MNQAGKNPDSEGGNGTLNAAIVGGGLGCESILKMVEGDSLARLNTRILGVAEVDPEARGARYAREIGIRLVTDDYRELFKIPDLDVIWTVAVKRIRYGTHHPI